MKLITIRNVARVATFILIVVGGIYRYQNPNRYLDQLNNDSVDMYLEDIIEAGEVNDFPAIDLSNNDIITLTGGDLMSGGNITGDVDIIKLILTQLEGIDSSNKTNPFGQEYTTVEMPFGSNTAINISGTTSSYTGNTSQGKDNIMNDPTISGNNYNNGSKPITGTNAGVLPQPNPQNNQIISSLPSTGEVLNTGSAINTPPNTNQYPPIQPINPQDTLTCTAPRGRKISALDRTFAFKYGKAVNNVCIIEKRICSQGILGGSYTQHTCYFDQPNGYYEYLGSTGSDSSKLIYDTEIKLGIDEASNRNGTQVYIDTINNTYNYNYNYTTKSDSQGSMGTNIQTQSGSKNNGGLEYIDHTTDMNYRLIPGYQGNNSPRINENDRTISTGTVIRYDLGPIKPRTPEIKISAARDAQINPNTNGVQGVINNQAQGPALNYSTQTPYGPNVPSINQPASCSTPWGYTVMHNQNIIAFENSIITQGQACQYEYRTCSFGYLRGSFTQQTCTISQS